MTIASRASRFVVGCGSNVVDRFFKVRALPKPGEKGFFASPTKTLENSIVGGVTLNHLAWARALGVPTALMALEGDDSSGRMIRHKLVQLGVSTEYIRTGDDLSTAESFVFSAPDGERTIIMASGSTSAIDAKVATESFSEAIAQSRMVTTEISQVPLTGVKALLDMARKASVPSILDIDVSPSVAIDEARLGDMATLLACVRTADVLKPAMHAAVELLPHLDNSVTFEMAAAMSSDCVAERLRSASGAQLVAMTDGAKPAVFSSDSGVTVSLAALPLSADSVVDATGAGDAFLGGLIAAMVHDGGIPSTEEQMRRAAELANAAGAACCQVLGALPVVGQSEGHLTSLSPRIASLLAQPGQSVEEAPAQNGEKDEEVGDHDEEESEMDDDEVFAELQRAVRESVGEGDVLARAVGDAVVNDVVAVMRLLEPENSAFLHGLVALSAQVVDVVSAGGHVHVTGVGKSGAVGRRLAASLASISVPAHFTHATEFLHGDLGCVRPSDLVVCLSHSGRTAECVSAFEHLRARHGPSLTLAAIVGVTPTSPPLLLPSTVPYSLLFASDPFGGVPAASLVVQEVAANALVRAVASRTAFDAAHFRSNHPGGAIGEKAQMKKE